MLLDHTLPGEVGFFWQISQPHGVESGWIFLPTALSNVLDKEYARYVNAEDQSKLRPVVSFGLHVTFGSLVTQRWLNDRTNMAPDGKRTAKKPNKNIMLLHFKPGTVELQLEVGPWRKVRCVRVTHEEAGEVVQPESLQSLLKDRLLDYESEAEGSDEADSIEAESEDAAFAEGHVAPEGEPHEPHGEEDGDQEGGSGGGRTRLGCAILVD